MTRVAGWLQAVSHPGSVAGGFLGRLVRRRRPGEAWPEAALGFAAAHMAQGLCLYDAQARLLSCNPRYCEIYGLPPDALRPGMSLREVVALRYMQGSPPAMAEPDYLAWRDKVGAENRQEHSVVSLANGRIVTVQRRAVPQGGWISTHEDITHRSRNEAQVAFLARHDALTGLPNRILFRERLNEALAGEGADRDGQRPERGVAVLYLDLDHFKAINDDFGHPTGDALLREVAERLRHCTREMDTVARLGGDEFAIIQRGVADASVATLLAHRVIEALRTPFHIDAHTLSTNASIGITLAPRDSLQAGKLLKNADLALYQAKANGRGVFRFFTPEMDAAIAARRQLEHDLQHAVREGDFVLHYQPEVALRSGRIAGFEALVRWRRNGALVPPNEFIPVAENTGLIVPLGRWILRRACLDAAAWPGRQRVAVNLSVAQFRDPALRDTVREALADSGLAPERLELEITESILMKDEETLLVLRDFRAMGIRIAMDDFGSGYSSLAYLRRFPFTRVKIDGGFVRDLDCSIQAEAIVRAVAELAHSLGMETTAEGVETEEQLKRLRRTACTEVQGFLFSPAVPAHEVAGLLHGQDARPEPDRRAIDEARLTPA